MHNFWTFPTANAMYTRSQNDTNMVVGKHGICTFKVVVVVLLLWSLTFDVFVSTSARPFLFWDKWFVGLYLNVSLTSTLKDYYNVALLYWNTTRVTFIGSNSCVSYQKYMSCVDPKVTWVGMCWHTYLLTISLCITVMFCDWGVQNGLWAIVPKAPPPLPLTWGSYATKYALHPTMSLLSSHVTQRNGALIQNWDNLL